MDAERTIVAVASPPGASARGIVRTSGTRSWTHVRAMLADGDAPPSMPSRGVWAARLASPPIPVIIVSMPGPSSATGEDCVEIHAPGNPLLLERLVDALVAGSRGDARRAHPGEFSARAVLSGAATLADADRVAHAIAAETDAQLQAARALEHDAPARAAAEDAEALAGTLALVEAGIDFTDQEDVVAIAPGDLRRRLEALVHEVHAIVGAAAGEEADRALPRVVLAGRPNAGKSTLFNVLLGRPRAVVSPIAGTTRDVLEEELTLGESRVLLCDCAGIEEARAMGVVAEAMQQRTRDAIEHADVVLWCDPSGRFDAADLPPTRARLIRVQTKADMAHSRANARGEAIEVSALDGFNVATLRRAIDDQAWGSGRTTRTLPARHRRALTTAASGLRRACEASAGERLRDPEVVASHLRGALDALGELTGRLTPDDVLGRVFATFCVGK